MQWSVTLHISYCQRVVEATGDCVIFYFDLLFDSLFAKVYLETWYNDYMMIMLPSAGPCRGVKIGVKFNPGIWI